ncbi:hypothetical protein E2978_21605 (plasmid) [Paracoccus yeei]
MNRIAVCSQATRVDVAPASGPAIRLSAPISPCQKPSRLAEDHDLTGHWGFQYALTCFRPRLDVNRAGFVGV